MRRLLLPVVVVVAIAGIFEWGAATAHVRPRLRTVYRVTPESDLATRHDGVGLAAADEAYMRAQDVLSQRQNMPAWTLGYRIDSNDGTVAVVDNWTVGILPRTKQPFYSSVPVRLRWNGSRWVVWSLMAKDIQSLGYTPSDYDHFTPIS